MHVLFSRANIQFDLRLPVGSVAAHHFRLTGHCNTACAPSMAGAAATVSVLGLIVFGTLASLLGKIGEQNRFRSALLEVIACHSNDRRALM